jgi:hypothetical protein
MTRLMSMSTVAVSVLFAPADPERLDAEDRKIHVIVPPAQASLVEVVGRMFEGRSDVEVVVDRRHGERRCRHQVVGIDRRRADRRRLRGDRAVVFERTTPPGGPPQGSP